MVIVAPLLLITYAILRLGYTKFPFFIQKRVGYKNQIFDIYKFKSMRDLRANEPADSVSTNRITRFGRLLRSSKIDELPQLWNILKGDMSFVGPRPLMYDPDFVSYPLHVQDRIYNVKPGVTAIGSVAFRDEQKITQQVLEEGVNAQEFKSNYIFPYKGELELWYQQNQSIWLDLKIFLTTIWVVVFPSSELVFSLFKGLPVRPAMLKHQFDKMEQLRESITLALLSFMVLLPLVPPPFWFLNNVHFVILAFFVLCAFLYSILRENKTQISLYAFDVFYLLFLLMGAMSYAWSDISSLVFVPWLIWLLFFLWVLVVRLIYNSSKVRLTLPLVLALSFGVILAYHFWALLIGTTLDTNWNSYFGKNANYSVSFLTALFPFLLFYTTSRTAVNLIKILGGAALVFLIFLISARGAFLAFCFTSLSYFLLVLYPIRKDWSRSLIALFALVSACVLWVVDIQNMIQLTIEEWPSRSYLNINSLHLMTDNWLGGVGLGNWYHTVYDYGVIGTQPFDDPSKVIRYDSHTLITRLGAELGVLGFVLIAVWFYFSSGIRNIRNIMKDNFCVAAIVSLFIYFIHSVFYVAANCQPAFFSANQFLGFTCFGVLSYNLRNKIPSIKSVRVTFALVSMVTL